MLRIFLFILLAYIGYQFIFNFLVPVIRTSRRIRKGFTEMQDRMNQHMQQQNGFNGTGTQAGKTTEKKDEAGDYIEFEEVK